MTSYERLKAALEHREPDRIPFDLGAAAVAGININALRALKKIPGFAGRGETPGPDNPDCAC